MTAWTWWSGAAAEPGLRALAATPLAVARVWVEVGERAGLIYWGALGQIGQPMARAVAQMADTQRSWLTSLEEVLLAG